MARLESPFPFIGTLGEVSVYKNRLTDKMIVRMKGGPSKHKIKTAASCRGIRDQNREFKGCGMANRNLFLAIHYVKDLKDFVVAGAFTRIVKAVQCMDLTHQKGQRDILFSTNRQFLEGFQLNRKNPFNTVFSHPVTAIIDRSIGKATVQIPEVLPGINFTNPWPYSTFRFIICIGAIYDIVPDSYGDDYELKHPQGNAGVEFVQTEWMATDSKAPGRSIELQLQPMVAAAIDDSTTIIVSIGIEFGAQSFTEIKPVKHVGCAKFLAVG